MKKRSENLPTGDGKKKNILPKILVLVAVTAVLLLVYRFAVVYRFYEILMWIYMGALGASIIAYTVINRGISNSPTPPDELPDDWSAVKKQKYLDDEKERRNKAKNLMFIALPLLIVFAVDLTDLYLADMLDSLGISDLMSAIFGGGK